MVDVFYFGQRWDAPAFDDAIEQEPPVGDTCGQCEESIEQGDSGTWQTFILGGPDDWNPQVRPVHIECWVRAGLGSPAHLRGQCSCAGHEEPPDDRSWRDQGREVVRMVREREGIFGG